MMTNLFRFYIYSPLFNEIYSYDDITEYLWDTIDEDEAIEYLDNLYDDISLPILGDTKVSLICKNFDILDDIIDDMVDMYREDICSILEQEKETTFKNEIISYDETYLRENYLKNEEEF